MDPTELASPAAAETSSRRRGRRIAILAGATLTVAALLVTLGSGLTAPAATGGGPRVGRPAPDFELEALDGSKLRLSGLRGSPVIVNFWASWCIPCREEAPLLTAADERYREEGLKIVGVLYQDSPDAARDFVGRYGQAYPTVLDPAGRTAIDYGVLGIPQTVFIDRSGTVIAQQIGQFTGSELDSRIAELLR